jgi:hypothetical protein
MKRVVLHNFLDFKALIEYAGFFLLIMLSVSCGRQTQLSPQIYCPEGNVSVNGQAAVFGMTLASGDIVECASQSFCYIQSTDDYLIIFPDSKAVFSFDAKKGNILTMDHGSAYVSLSAKKISLSASGFIFQAVKNIRGFLTAFESSAEVRLGSGELLIKRDSDKNESSLRPGYSIAMSDGILFSAKPLNDSEIREFPTFENFKRDGRGDSALCGTRWNQEIKSALLSFDLKLFKVQSSLRQLAARLGPLSCVKTISGREIIGAMSIRGPKMQIQTTDGLVEIPAKEVKTVTHYEQ